MGKKEDILKKVESSIDMFLKRMEDTLPKYLYGERFQKNVRKAVGSAMERIGAVTRDDLDEFADKILNRLGKVIGPERASALKGRLPRKKEVVKPKLEETDKDAKKPEAKKETHGKTRGRKPTAVKRTCSIKGCNNTHRSKGYCTKHYSQWRRGTLKK